jgi:hypothetical protein
MITTYMSLTPLIVKGVSSCGLWARVTRTSDNADREWRIADLRADTIAELEEALECAPVYTEAEGRS